MLTSRVGEGGLQLKPPVSRGHGVLKTTLMLPPKKNSSSFTCSLTLFLHLVLEVDMTILVISHLNEKCYGDYLLIKTNSDIHKRDQWPPWSHYRTD